MIGLAADVEKTRKCSHRFVGSFKKDDLIEVDMNSNLTFLPLINCIHLYYYPSAFLRKSFLHKK